MFDFWLLFLSRTYKICSFPAWHCVEVKSLARHTPTVRITGTHRIVSHSPTSSLTQKEKVRANEVSSPTGLPASITL